MRVIAVLAWSLLGLLNACAGSSTHEPGAGGGGASATGGGANGGSASGAPASDYCAATPPPPGSACKPRPTPSVGFGTRADCSWGDDPRPACRTLGSCSNGAWVISEPGADCAAPPKPASCPDAPASAGSACTDATLQCWYDDGTVCSCSGCEGGAEYPLCRTIDPPEWACTKPTMGCPNPPPQAGSACSDAGLSCGISCELPIHCDNGAWQYGQAMCPICAAPDTPIATPSGERAIADLRVGDLVYSVDHGAISVVPIARVASTPVAHHRVLRMVLSNGAELQVSPGHPLANGKPLSSLRPGDALDELYTVERSELVPYGFARTYDILPASSTGTYFASGALLGSTLAR